MLFYQTNNFQGQRQEYLILALILWVFLCKTIYFEKGGKKPKAAYLFSLEFLFIYTNIVKIWFCKVWVDFAPQISTEGSEL